MGLGRGTVADDLKVIRAGYKQKFSTDIEIHLATELEKIEREEESLAAIYELSCRPKRTASAAKHFDADGKVEGTTSAANQVERPEGDVRILAQKGKLRDQKIQLFVRLAGLGEKEKKQKIPTTLEEFFEIHPFTFTDAMAVFLKQAERREKQLPSSASNAPVSPPPAPGDDPEKK